MRPSFSSIATYGFDSQADEIRDVVPRYRYDDLIRSGGRYATMPIKKEQELCKFCADLAKSERDRMALRFTKCVTQLAQEVEVQLRVSPRAVQRSRWSTISSNFSMPPRAARYRSWASVPVRFALRIL
jgi:hypothetical protein